MNNRLKETDVILIGAGVMSATLGSLLKEVAPDWNIKVFEKLTSAGEESSNEWNNAGTGHVRYVSLTIHPNYLMVLDAARRSQSTSNSNFQTILVLSCRK